MRHPTLSLTILAAIAIALIAWAGTSARAAHEMITGTASFPQNTTLPPDAVFEVSLQDVSRADAPAQEIARARIESPGPPPIAFSIAYDPAAIDERHTYVIRTRVVSGARMILTSDTANPVLTRGAPREVSVMMRVVANNAAATSPNPGGAHQLINGMFVYMADAARLTECRTGRSYPVAMEGEYLRLEKAYIDARQGPGEPLMITFEGGIDERPRMEGEGTEATAIVTRFINAWPEESCERNRADASLTNTYWRIVQLGNETIRAVDGSREPHLLLRANEPRFNATVGCNQLIGGFESAGETLRFSQALSTRMACPPPLNQYERYLAEVLTATRTWHIAGQILELRNGEGQPLALLQAVYLR